MSSNRQEGTENKLTAGEIHQFCFWVAMAILAILIGGSTLSFLRMLHPLVFAVSALPLLLLLLWTFNVYLKAESMMAGGTA